MDIQFWIWLAIIVISFLARAFKAKPEETRKADSGQPLGPVSFEELLKEIQADKPPVPAQKPIEPRAETDDFQEAGSGQRNLQAKKPPYVTEERTSEIYEKAKMEVFTRPSLEDTMKLSDTVVRYDKFKGYQAEQTSMPLNYIDGLHDPEGLKRAFVLNEVLMRKF